MQVDLLISRSSRTQRVSVDNPTPKSSAISCLARPLVKASRTASRLNYGVGRFPWYIEHLLVPQLAPSTFPGKSTTGVQNCTPFHMPPLPDGTHFTLETGLYAAGDFGVRLENLLQMRYHGPQTMTSIPFDVRRTYPELLTAAEKHWVQNSNNRCLTR